MGSGTTRFLLRFRVTNFSFICFSILKGTSLQKWNHCLYVHQSSVIWFLTCPGINHWTSGKITLNKRFKRAAIRYMTMICSNVWYIYGLKTLLPMSSIGKKINVLDGFSITAWPLTLSNVHLINFMPIQDFLPHKWIF